MVVPRFILLTRMDFVILPVISNLNLFLSGTVLGVKCADHSADNETRPTPVGGGSQAGHDFGS